MKHLFTVNNSDGYAVVIKTSLSEAKESKDRLEKFHRETLHEDSKFTITRFVRDTGKSYSFDEILAD